LYVYKGNFNHFEHKLCKTKPNSEMPKMIITSSQITSYHSPVTIYQYEKQSQTKPKFIYYKGYKARTNPNQSQYLHTVRRDKAKFYSLQVDYPPEAGKARKDDGHPALINQWTDNQATGPTVKGRPDFKGNGRY
jgi:hypothetical protein